MSSWVYRNISSSSIASKSQNFILSSIQDLAMPYRYEIWSQHIWQETTGNPPSQTTSTLDMAMEFAKGFSSLGDIYFVLDKSQSPSKVRGFGRDGKWINAVENCKRCSNSGRDYSLDYDLDEEDTCKTCQGASWKPF